MKELDELVRKLDSQREELVAYVKQLNDEQIGQRKADTEWCPKEQLLHLARTEPLFVDWALQIRSSPGCTIASYAGNPESYPEAFDMSLSDLLECLEQARKDTIKAIQDLSMEDLQQQGKHSSFGDLSVLQMLRAIYRHNRMHLEQMQGKQTSFQPKPEN